MSASDILLKMQQVGYAYDAGNTAVYGIDLDIHSGEVLLVTGANGAGKTSLLKLLGGFVVATEGNIVFAGKNIVDIPESRLDEWVAFVRTEGEKALVGPTVEDELARACRMCGLTGSAIPERVGQALNAVQLTGAKNWYIDEMSMGERRRVALAAALIGRPRVVILDDPMSELDAQGARMVGRILNDLARRGLAVVFSSHNLDPAVGMTDRVVVLDQGGIVLDGPPAKILAEEKILRDSGLQLPPGTELVRRLREKGIVKSEMIPITVDETVAFLLEQLS